MQVSTGLSLKIDAPEFFRDPDFIRWLNNGQPKFTWHQGASATEWSDVMVLVDPGLTGEGSDSDMPEHIWNQIIDACRQHLGAVATQQGDHIPVRLTNVG